jgi:hypothetical protein
MFECWSSHVSSIPFGCCTIEDISQYCNEFFFDNDDECSEILKMMTIIVEFIQLHTVFCSICYYMLNVPTSVPFIRPFG